MTQSEDWEVRWYTSEGTYQIMQTKSDGRKRFSEAEAEEIAQFNRELYGDDFIVAKSVLYKL